MREFATVVAFGTIAAFAVASASAAETLIFEELFEDSDWSSRGWYDNNSLLLSTDAAPESQHSCHWQWDSAGMVGPGEGAGRRLFSGQGNVIVSFWKKYSDNWSYGDNYQGPHLMHLLTDVDGIYQGFAYTHLTFYFEEEGRSPAGRLRVSIQDGQNIDLGHIGQNLVGVTENRSVAGCNGNTDGYDVTGPYGDGSCYDAGGGVYWNGKWWQTSTSYFSDTPGSTYRGDWHHIKIRVQLNTILGGIGQTDGILQYWYDGQLVMDYHDVFFRTGQHPDMKINQIAMAPYFGPGVPQEQSIWIDDLRVLTGEPEADTTPPAPPNGLRMDSR
jgi:hypothetical protein